MQGWGTGIEFARRMVVPQEKDTAGRQYDTPMQTLAVVSQEFRNNSATYTYTSLHLLLDSKYTSFSVVGKEWPMFGHYLLNELAPLS